MLLGRARVKQLEKEILFRDFHQRSESFILPTPWDIGTAQFLSQMGFEGPGHNEHGPCLLRWAEGQDTGSRTDAGAHRADSSATDRPVSADLEIGRLLRLTLPRCTVNVLLIRLHCASVSSMGRNRSTEVCS